MEFRGVPRLLGSSEEDKEGRERIASNITQLIGWTPLIELKNLMMQEELEARIVAKLEFYQPLSSVKDRSALRMIEDAEERGLISPKTTTLIEPTGGNLGIGLAFTAVQKGYNFIAVMAYGYSLEKQMLIKYLGGDVLLTDPELGLKGMYAKVEELREKNPNSYVLDQFANPANPDAHFRGTGPEIWKDTAGKIDILICGSGSGGTLSGAGRYLKMKNPALKCIVVEPAESPVISGGCAAVHRIQGMGPGIIPATLDTTIFDEIIKVSAEESMVHARRLARVEGILIGISSGAAVAAALQTARKKENKGKMIVTVFPSCGERYLSTDLFSELREECIKMTF